MARDQGESELILKGGTDAAMAPPVWYYQHVCLPLLRIWWGLEADLQVLTASVSCMTNQHGFYCSHNNMAISCLCLLSNDTASLG